MGDPPEDTDAALVAALTRDRDAWFGARTAPLRHPPAIEDTDSPEPSWFADVAPASLHHTGTLAT